MKLRNLMYATMIACAFASCSKDEDGIDNGGGQGNADATLSVKVLTSGVTKAADDDEAAIKSLSAYIFDATGAIEKKVDFETDEIAAEEVVDVELTAGAKTVFVLANQTPEIASLTAVSSALDLANENTTNGYSMNSKAYTFTIAANTHHYLGYTDDEVAAKVSDLPKVNVSGDAKKPVQLYRNIAKISLNKITFSPTSNFGSDAKLIISGVYLLHTHGKANLLPAEMEEWASTEASTNSWLNGATNKSYAQWVLDLANVEASELVKQYLPESVTYANASYLNKSPEAAIELLKSANTEDFASDYSFAYENTDGTYHTLLVVAAKMEYGDVKGDKAPVRYYPISVGRQGLKAGANVVGETNDSGFTATGQRLNGITRNELGVLRNMQYNLSLTITGLGYQTPFGPKEDDYTGILDVQCEVVPFGQVNQEVEI